MTLLATEIHRHSRSDAMIVFAADRRISLNGARDSEQPKIFRVDSLRAGIGYFGLAEVPLGATTQPMAAWLHTLVAASRATSLEDFARHLAAELNWLLPDDWRRMERSGFHLCGFSQTNQPEFWYVRNVDDSPAQAPTGRFEVREEFQSRDAPRLPEGAVQIYRNGDIRAHVTAWAVIDDAFGELLGAPRFRTPNSVGQYEEWVRFKMETIAQFYETFSEDSIIGRPVDVFSISRMT